ncbi:hypothetical protein NQ317_009618 [Molorchus minor]|uniref:Uncharacterized protein n=1 Tax=Molorchus minor TaxID=1323400 RepID=A0ABQ9JKY4_9CUCU|nr:hypothetical protein NQ317_009618 [Molorchus minor]
MWKLGYSSIFPVQLFKTFPQNPQNIIEQFFENLMVKTRSMNLNPNQDDSPPAGPSQSHPPGVVIEPYKLSEVFSIIPEFDGNQIALNTFLNSCSTAFDMAIGNQKILLTIHIKNKLKGRAAELINSRNPTTWDEIKKFA